MATKKKVLKIIESGYTAWWIRNMQDNKNFHLKKNGVYGDFGSHIYFMATSGSFIYMDSFLSPKDTKTVLELIHSEDLICDPRIRIHQGERCIGYTINQKKWNDFEPLNQKVKRLSEEQKNNTQDAEEVFEKGERPDLDLENICDYEAKQLDR